MEEVDQILKLCVVTSEQGKDVEMEREGHVQEEACDVWLDRDGGRAAAVRLPFVWRQNTCSFRMDWTELMCFVNCATHGAVSFRNFACNLTPICKTLSLLPPRVKLWEGLGNLSVRGLSSITRRTY